MQEPTDIELLRQARSGRHQSFHTLVNRHAPAMLRLARSLVPERESDDLLQETFLAAFKALNTFEERSSVKTWLYAILFRQAALIRRKLGKPVQSLFDDAPSTRPDAIRQTDARLDLQSALAELPADMRTILILRELDGLSYEQIAAVLELPRGTVESRLFRARQALKAWLLPRSGPN